MRLPSVYVLFSGKQAVLDFESREHADPDAFLHWFNWKFGDISRGFVSLKASVNTACRLHDAAVVFLQDEVRKGNLRTDARGLWEVVSDTQTTKEKTEKRT